MEKKTGQKPRQWFKEMAPETVSWLAGLLQAEAQFSKDNRERSNISSSDYTPPPPAPFIKIEMVEHDLMLHVADLMGENCNIQNRKTNSGKLVWRVSMYRRDKVEAFLKLILPYVYGDLKRGIILDLLKDCENYNTWVLQGEKKKMASHAARIRASRATEG